MKQKNNITEVVFILDRSGSMAGLESDTIGGYNSLLKKQLELEGEVRVTTILFDDRYEVLHQRQSLHLIQPMTSNQYFVRGTTALLDAMGVAISNMIEQNDYTNVAYRADKILFVITTDGLENASKQYSYDQIKKLIDQQKEQQGWEFIFLGANIDASKEASKLGIDKERAVTYCNDSEGVTQNYEAISDAMSEMRMYHSISNEWKTKVKKVKN